MDAFGWANKFSFEGTSQVWLAAIVPAAESYEKRAISRNTTNKHTSYIPIETLQIVIFIAVICPAKAREATNSCWRSSHNDIQHVYVTPSPNLDSDSVAIRKHNGPHGR